jgi:hypothetical protein
METVNVCPKCGESLGIIQADLVHVGTLLEHEKWVPSLGTKCGAVLIVTAINGPCMDVRLATEEEKRR